MSLNAYEKVMTARGNERPTGSDYIRGIFTAMNMNTIYGNLESAKGNYNFATKFQGHAGATACIECGQCESVCPQHIGIIGELKKCAQVLEG